MMTANLSASASAYTVWPDGNSTTRPPRISDSMVAIGTAAQHPTPEKSGEAHSVEVAMRQIWYARHRFRLERNRRRRRSSSLNVAPELVARRSQQLVSVRLYYHSSGLRIAPPE